MNNEELLIKKAASLLEIIQRLDSSPISIDNNPTLKESLLGSGEVLARAIYEDKPALDSIRERAIRKQRVR